MKTGIHANTLRDADLILEYYRRSQAPTFKAMDFDEGFFKTLKGVCPHVQIIGRVYEDNQQLGASGGRFNKKVVEYARAFPTVDFWEGYNEAFPTPGDIGRYAELEVERVTMLAAVGKRAIVGNFSCGTPEITGADPARCWREFLPAVKAAMAHRGGVGRHEYDAPWMDRLVGGDIWNPTADGWLCLRYRKDAKIIAGLGVPLVHWYFTETGVDGGVTNRPGPVGGGWADFTGYPSPALGAYDKQRRWYSWQLSHDPTARGLVSFGESSADPTWHSFSMIRDRAMMDAIIAAESDLPIWHVGTPTPPPPPEAPMLQGIDVSHWQGSMDWRKAADAGAVYAWLKASDGSTYVDPEYARNAAGARDAGLLFGPYHYFRNSIDPILQADHFARVVKSGPEPTLPPALDFEDTTGEISAVNMRKFVERVNALLGRPIIYTGAWYWTPARLGGTQEWAKLFPLWIADYDGAVAIPSDWRDWTVHQYTSSGDGIAFGADSARIDRNRYRGTREELAVLRIPPPAPPSSIDVAKLWAQAAANQAIRLNPAAGLQRAILAAGMEVVSNEWDYDEAHVAQLGQGAATGSKQAVYVYDKATGRIIRHNQQ